MDLVNASCGRVNHCHSHTDSDASAIHRVMINKRDTLKGIKTEIAHLSGEIAQLVEKKSAIEKDLDLLGAVLKPACNHDLLPNEILGHVFILVVQDYGLVDFPMCPEFIAPPQLTISHVCSRWRRVALCTPELWSNTHLIYLRSNPKLNHVTWLHQRWLARAGTSPVSLSIYFDKCMNGYEIANTLQKIILPFRIKKLHLALTYQAFMYLATFSFSESALSDFMEVSLAVMIPSNELETASSGDINNPHFIPRLRSVKFLTSDSLAYWNPLDDWLDRNHQSLPWSQLRSMDVEDLPLDNLELLFNILHQIPMLQALKLGIYPSAAKVTVRVTVLIGLKNLSRSLNVRAVRWSAWGGLVKLLVVHYNFPYIAPKTPRIDIIKDILDQTKWSWLCFIVVGKKHHQRFFPRSEDGRDMRICIWGM